MTCPRIVKEVPGVMRLPKGRFTVWGLMALVLVTGIGLHLSASAWRAHRYDTPHLHSAIVSTGGNPGKATMIRREPFWPAFSRQSAGIAWGSGCFMGGEAMLELCELAHPEIRIPSGPNMYVPRFTEEQTKLVERLGREYRAR